MGSRRGGRVGRVEREGYGGMGSRRGGRVGRVEREG